jgi:deoxyribodipyrimidine photo-lyase
VEGNHALLFAAELANRLKLPLLVFESLGCTYPSANDRLHTFVLEGIPEMEARLRQLGIGYVFHLERHAGTGRAALEDLLREAAALVTDDYPETLAARREPLLPDPLEVECYAVDSSCVVPSAAIGIRVYAAYSIRPRIQKLLPAFLTPVRAVEVRRAYRERVHPAHAPVRPKNIPELVASCEIDHHVQPSICFRGGRGEAERRLGRFLEDRLRRYAREKNEPAAHVTSDLSPYLHFGHISSLEVALAVQDYAREHKLMAAEFLEELIVRRELAFNFARYATRLDSLEELPEWARATLREHGSDRRAPSYTREQFENAATHDDLWNAAQKELLLRGKIHGYYRMYWGKKILEWSPTPEEALASMIHLHDRYAVDGQDPNTYANILWCFGLHDRPWPERPVYGKVRSMSRAGMERKTDVAAYLREMEDLERRGKELAT